MSESSTSRNTMRVQLTRSVHGRLRAHRACVRGLGLRRIHQIVEVEDTPATRGMLNKVAYMVTEVKEATDASQ
jgi:large subunit ribosomal protein L30